MPHLYTPYKNPFAMFKLLSTAAILLLSASNTCAKHKNDRLDLATKNIPTDLINNFTNAVLRYDSTYLKIVGINEVEYYHHYAVTIMNEKGKDYGNILLHYGTLNEINDISGTYYDSNGQPIEQIRNKNIQDRSTFGSDNVFNTDSRMKSYQYVSTVYPYTVVISTKATIRNTLFLPDWQPQENHDLSVFRSVFYLDYPDTIAIRTKAYNMPPASKMKQQAKDGRKVYSWNISHQVSFEIQPFSETGNFNTATIVLAVQEFDLMGYRGKLDTWKNLGLFYYTLNKSRDQLSPEMTAKIKSLVKSDSSVMQKIQTLYQYMQQNTRYVAEESGLSGWQTFPASEVCQKGYGDCKGLTNYLKALLKTVGIPAYMTLASAGSYDYYKVDPTFPNNYFNHVILCVPNGRDSIWIECTSPVFQAGYLGDFTDDRYVLICGPDGGKLVKTPVYDQHKNYIRRTATFQIEPDATQQVINLNNYYSGPMQDNLYMLLKTASKDEIQKAIHTKFNFPSYKINKFHYTFEGTHLMPAIEEHIDATVNGIVNHTGKRYFVQISWIPNPMNKIIQTTPRTKPLVLNRSFTINDSVVFSIPAGFDVEYLPESSRKNYPFASLAYTYNRIGSHVVYTQKYTQNKGVYNADDFEHYQDLYRKINQQSHADNIVLVRQ